MPASSSEAGHASNPATGQGTGVVVQTAAAPAPTAPQAPGLSAPLAPTPAHSPAGSASASASTLSTSTEEEDSTVTSTETSPHHTHRQNHNSSKLPAFRFADLNNQRQSLARPSLPQPQNDRQPESDQQQQQQTEPHQGFPPSPVSPKPGQLDAPIHQPEKGEDGPASTADKGVDRESNPPLDRHAASGQGGPSASSSSATVTVTATATGTRTGQAPPTRGASGSSAASSNTNNAPLRSAARRKDPGNLHLQTRVRSNNSSDLDSAGSDRDIPRETAIGSDAEPHPRLTSHRALFLRQHHQPDSPRDHRQPSSPSIKSRLASSPDRPDSEEHPQKSPRNRASTYQTSANSAAPTSSSATTASRPASYPDTPSEGTPRSQPPTAQASHHVANRTTTKANTTTTAPTRPRIRSRRALASSGSNDSETTSDNPPSASDQRPYDAEFATASARTSGSSAADGSTKDWTQGQRELILPKSTQLSSPTDEKRQSVRSRPPLSFRAPPSATTGSVRVAPIRSFRSSGSRRSSGQSMTSPSIHAGDSSGDDYPSYGDGNQRDRTLRALEGRFDDDVVRKTPSYSARPAASQDGDDTTGDVFMKIAGQEPQRRGVEGNGSQPERPSISRVARSSHRRPLSAAVPSSSFQPTSPQRVRRLSDQQEASRPRSRQADEDTRPDVTTRGAAYRTYREKAASAHPGEELRLSRVPASGYRTSPVTPRSYAFQDASGDNSPYNRRRTSVTESSAGHSARNSGHKPPSVSHPHARTYSSSPLVPRHDAHHDTHHGPEGTESTASTTAPSTVWDELDDLKSRIHRLELTGKLPSTSSAAINKVLDDRPPTATNTTVSTSPKQATAHTAVQNDAVSTVSTHRDSQPVLLSAIDRSKPLLSEDVSRALESAASEAVSLLAMMGSVGQPGPISSGASTIGAGGSVTDRQLRRRAEGVCRSLTELVLALGEEAGHTQPKALTVQTGDTTQKEGPATPTLNKTFPNLPTSHQRRGSVTGEKNDRSNSIPSPRAMTRLEEKRSTMLSSSTLTNPRYASGQQGALTSPSAANSTVSRRSSLFINRTRRAATEEPEDGRRSSMMLRTRRAGTEEPDEGRTSTVRREHRDTDDADGEEDHFRPPSRAFTDVNPPRAVSHHYQSQAPGQEASPLGGSALPRRRIGSTMLNSSRLASPPVSANNVGNRRYLERSTPDRDGNSVAEKLAEDRGQRHTPSSGQAPMLSRTGSLLRRPNRDSTIGNSSSPSQVGAYR